MKKSLSRFFIFNFKFCNFHYIFCLKKFPSKLLNELTENRKTYAKLSNESYELKSKNAKNDKQKKVL
jgi:hypothetical protein